MFAGFEFRPSKLDEAKLMIVSTQAQMEHHCYDAHKKEIKKSISKYLAPDGSLDASMIKDNRFPEVNAQVFISHSHRDEKLANQLALYLHKECKIESFIDSIAWHYADDLLREIDDKYCLKMKSNDAVYDYSERNRSTANVYMILQSALATMIDKCECFIFINTSSSIIPSDRTRSPWIYSELLMANILRRRLPERHKKLLDESTKIAALEFTYPAYHKLLQDITLGDIDLAKKATGITDGTNSKDAEQILDQLYINKGLI